MSSLYSISMGLRGWRLPALRAVGALGIACLLVTGCGGDNGSDPKGIEQNTPVAGDGSAAGQTPIVALPTQGCDVAQGGNAVRPPLLNTQLDCAP